MTITPHRDAAAATVAEARRLNAARAPGEPWQAIARRMDVDVTEVVMIGYGELKDIGEHTSRCGPIVIRVLASALASFILTACGSREDLARRLLDAALSDLKDAALDRIAAAPTEGISASVTPAETRGHA